MPLRENEEKWLSGLIDGRTEEDCEMHKKIFDGIATIQTWFEQNFKDNQEKEGYFSTFLHNNVCFALVELAEDTDLNQFFVRMNNRGKQLEKHEILKVRLLNAINKEDKQKYAKIWDLCSDMDKYIFQSASDRDFFKKNTDIQDRKSLYEILMSEDHGDAKTDNVSENKKDDDLEKVRSIIDFPTFLLHVAKLVNKTDGDISINKDKLLDIISLQTTENPNTDREKKLLILGVEVENFICAMLKYRILFDYFVIKQMLDKRLSKQREYAIKRFYKKDNSYTIAVGNSMEKLALIQNYLRVAREGEKQNYHHWLTPFLSFLYKEIEIRDLEITKDQKIKIGNFLNDNFEDWLLQENENKNGKENELIGFLEKLDKDLAFAQLGIQNNEDNNFELLDIVKYWIEKGLSITWQECSRDDIKNILKILNAGVRTPHYWFYRLEYYLMLLTEDQYLKILDKNKKDIDKNFNFNKFNKVANNYRFRYIDSIEHIQPQSRQEGWGNVDIFGNLALISKDFNSSLNNQKVGDKYQDIVKRVNNGNIQSLKMFLAYASMKDNNGNIIWNSTTAKKHQTEMLKILKASLESKG